MPQRPGRSPSPSAQGWGEEDLTVWCERAGVVVQLEPGTHYPLKSGRAGGAVVLTSGALDDDIITIDGHLTDHFAAFLEGSP